MTPRSRVKELLKAVLGEYGTDLLRQGLRERFITGPKVLWQDFLGVRQTIKNRFRYQDSEQVLLARLRTQTHILDKSLRAENWESGRGRLAWQRCKRLINTLRDTSVATDPSFQWAIETEREFEAASASDKRLEAEYEPFCQGPEMQSRFIAFIKSRRSIRSFQERGIEHELLCELVEAVNWAPQSCNRQPTFFYITQNPHIIRTCIRQCAGATGLGANLPCFVSVCADTRFYELRDRHLPLIDASLGTQSFLLAAHAHGIEGTILNWMHRTRSEDRHLREALGIEPYYRIVFNMVLGYPARSAPPPGRKGLESTCSFV